MKRIIIGFLSLFLFVPLFAQEGDNPVTDKDTVNQPMYAKSSIEIYQLDNNAYLLKELTAWTANIIAITSDDGILLMDTGFKGASKDLMDALAHLGNDVKIVINTHPHGDHIGGNDTLGGVFELIAHKNSIDEIPIVGNKIIALDKKYSFKFSNKDVVCIPSAYGHSEGDIIIYIPDINIVFMGDLYLSESFPLLKYGQGAKSQYAIKNLKEVLEILPTDTRIFSGHGKETNISDLTAYIVMLEETNDIIKTAMGKGMTLQEMKDSDLLKNYGQWGKFFSFITKETWIEDIYNSYL